MFRAKFSPIIRSTRLYLQYLLVFTQQDALYRLIYYSKSALHVSGEVFAHHQEHLTVFTVSGSVHPSSCRLVLPAGVAGWCPEGHQQVATWMNITRYFKYSQVLLMTGENIAQNM